MSSLSIKTTPMNITLKIAIAVSLIILAYKGLDYGIQGLSYFSFEETGIMAWLCWVPQLMVVDYWLQLRNQKLATSDTYAKIKA